MYDIVIRNGEITSGMENPWFHGDVVIEKDKIAKIGRTIGEESTKVIHARGYCVSPGFIDGHSHSDLFWFLIKVEERL
jgi:N-acyl-D-aspartate/D-glutamate deacylase